MSLIRFARILQRANASESVRPRPSYINFYGGGFHACDIADTDQSDSQWRSSFIVRYVSSAPSTTNLRPTNKHSSGKSKFKRDMEKGRNATSEKSKRTTQIHQLKRKIKDLSEGLQPQTRENKRSSAQHVKRTYTKTNLKPIQGPFSVFASCLPGLEPFLLQEVQYLLASVPTQQAQTPTKARAVPGGVKIIVPTLAHLHVLHLYLGTASHIYLRLNDDGIASSTGIPPLFRARGFPELQRKLKDLILSQRWDMLLNVPRSSIPESSLPWQLQVHVTTSKSKLMHTKAVEERVRQTIGQTLGIQGLESNSSITTVDLVRDGTNKSAGDRPVVRLLVRIDRDEVQFSLDSSSSRSATPLHMRGYRLNPHKAPLREDLAYALLMAGGLKPSWDLQPLRSFFGEVVNSDIDTEPESNTAITPGESFIQLFDPLCGSGTIAIEGASILAELPPGRFRQPPFLGTELCDVRLWDEMKSKALSEIAVSNKRNTYLVAANDINTEAINAAKSNSKRAGVDHLIDFSVGSFKIHPLSNNSRQSKFNTSRSEPLFVITNPPYGNRLSVDETQPSTYKQIAKGLKTLPYKVQCTMIGNDPRTLRESSLPLKVAFSTKHGGMNVVAMTGTINN